MKFKAKLARPVSEGKAESWTFVLLPTSVSAKLPTRAMASVEGTLNGAPFLAVAVPDGKGGHWLKVEKKLRLAAGADAGDTVEIELASATEEVELPVPPDLRKALAATPEAKAVWTDITTIARRDWIFWITTAKTTETRARRIANACSMLAGGKRRVCCFDRSGTTSKAFSAPIAQA